ncbi:MAG: LysM peptidoglycan-binding domain-containing protein [SAR324 cluster bacterium]|jgi:membrane-bound lytic murein transglycosylase D|nr:LysM peptidoglycan-binding domain-containing protein [SAR324 cluster bacterium]
MHYLAFHTIYGVALATLLTLSGVPTAWGETQYVLNVSKRPTYDIPVVDNRQVRRLISFYTGRKRKQLIEGIRHSGRYLPMMRRILKEEGLPQDLVFMVPAESNFNNRARSHMNAVGLWQFIASTGRIYGLTIDEWVDERRDPVLATRAAARFLKRLHERFGDWTLAMAAYNTGPRRVDQAMRYNKRRRRPTDFWNLRRLPRETRGYLPAILALAVIYKHRDYYGLGQVRIAPPMAETQIVLPSTFSMKEVAQRAGLSFQTLRQHNLVFYRSLPPLNQKTYKLYLPLDRRKQLVASIKANPKHSTKWVSAASGYLPNTRTVTRLLEKHGAPNYFRVRRGDSLWVLAKKHQTSVGRLAYWNRLKTSNVLRVGRRLKVYTPTWDVFQKIAALPKPQRQVVASKHRSSIRVRRGTTLSQIALRYGTSVKQLMAWNDLNRPEDLRAGQRLRIKPLQRQTTKATASRNGGAIQVRRGTTLSGIALRHKVSVRELLAWNNLRHPKALRAGQWLRVKPPRKATAPTSGTSSQPVVQQHHHEVIRVRRGDSLWSLARHYGTSVKKLIALNDLKSGSHLQINQELIVPVAKKT